MTLQALIDRYRAADTERERAHVEAELHAFARAAQVNHEGRYGRAATVARILQQAGVTVSEYAIRHRLTVHALGAWAEQLWPLTDSTPRVALRTASRIAGTLRDLSWYLQRPIDQAMFDAVLVAWQRLPIRQTSDGLVYLGHVEVGTVAAMMGAAPPRATPPPPSPPPEEPPAPPPEHDHDRTHMPPHGAGIRAAVWGALNAIFQTGDDELDDLTKREIAIEIEAFLAGLRRIVARVRRQRMRDRRAREAASSVAGATVGRAQLLQACETLHMPAPSPGAPLDLNYARRQKHKLARLYHPDAHGGATATLKQYHAVLDAWDVVHRYATAQHGAGSTTT